VRLENIAIALRQRTAWEAIDLGYAMTQTWWTALIKAWCAVYLPVALLINLICWKYPPLAVIILWWLKPAFDRVVLHVLSGAVFGAAPTLSETLRALKRLWWKNGLFAALTYARFNPARSFTLPVVQLEGLRNKLGTKRRRVLAREGSGAAIGLTVMSMFFEVTMLFSIYLLINLFSPGDAVFSFDLQSMMNPEKDQAAHYLSNAINAIVISMLEPFYVAAGFAIYLNCRTAIEGWDVELQFKRMAVRVASQQVATEQRNASASNSAVQRAAAALLIASGLAFAFAPTDDARAQTQTQAQTQTAKEDASTDTKQAPAEPSGDALVDGDDSDKPDGSITPDTGAAEVAKRVLDGKEFGEFQKSWRIKYVGPRWGEDKPKQKTDQKWLVALAEFFASGARVFAWIGGALLVLFLIYLIARHVGLNGWRVGKSRDLPEVLFGLDVRPESLPDNVTDAARNLLAAGDIRGAVSLMYRGALVSLIQDGRIDISRGDTELQLLARVRRAYGSEAYGDAKARYFATLVSIWQRVAYARQMIAAAEIAPLIDTWATHFNVRRNESTGGALMLSQAREAVR
jgi:hypothetical protein